MKRIYVSLIVLWLFLSVSGCQMTGNNVSFKSLIPLNEIYATNLSFDVATGEIRYTLPQPALVRVRVGIRDAGPLLRNLVDWEKRPAGPNVEVWNKKDQTGEIDFGERSDLMVVLKCIPLETKEYQVKLSREDYRKAPQLNISFPDSIMQEDGIPLVKDKTAVRVTLDRADKAWLEETKYELGLYIDYVFVIEEEEGINPFTYRLDTKSFNDGPHTIIVNISGYQGEIGTQSALIFVRNHN